MIESSDGADWYCDAVKGTSKRASSGKLSSAEFRAFMQQLERLGAWKHPSSAVPSGPISPVWTVEYTVRDATHGTHFATLHHDTATGDARALLYFVHLDYGLVADEISCARSTGSLLWLTVKEAW